MVGFIQLQIWFMTSKKTTPNRWKNQAAPQKYVRWHLNLRMLAYLVVVSWSVESGICDKHVLIGFVPLHAATLNRRRPCDDT